MKQKVYFLLKIFVYGVDLFHGRYGLEGAGVNDHIIRAKKARKDARKLTAVYDSIFIQYEALKEIRKDLDIGSQAVVAFVTFEDLHGYRRCLRALSSAGGRRICPKLSRRAAEQRLARTDSGFITESSSVVDNQFTVPTLKGKRLRASPAPPPGASTSFDSSLVLLSIVYGEVDVPVRLC